MKLFYKIISNVAFAMNLLLLFFLVTEQQVQVPGWLQSVGRMHPMLLHLPIGLLLLLALFPLLKKTIDQAALYQTQLFVTALACLTACLTAIMGFLLAREPGYSGDLVDQHKWAGIVLSWSTYGLFLWLKSRPHPGPFYHAAVLANVVVVVLAGHFGAGITHGEDYLLAPLQNEEVVITEETPVYQALIHPLLQQKCFSCHNDRKAKGGLIMSDFQKFKKGGENGPAFIPGDPEQSLLVQRLELPLDQEEHMPPEGKPQLSTEERQLLREWIALDGSNQSALRETPSGSLLSIKAGEALADAGPVEEPYPFSPASEEVIRQLNIPFRSVTPLSAGSPALRAGIFIRETYQARFLEELLQVKEQLVELKLDHLPVKDEELPVIGKFPNLEVLILNNTDIGKDHLAPLGQCKRLRSLSLSGTPVDTSLAPVLRSLPGLEHLYVWNTGLDSLGGEYLRSQFPGLNIHLGYIPQEGELMALSPPAFRREINLEGLEEIHLHHNFPGAVIRFTIDGSEPDSIHSPKYEEPVILNRTAVVNARAFREKWLGSEVASTIYFPKSIPVREAKLLTAPNPKYPGRGAEGLIDGKKGFSNNFLSPFWIGFQDHPFEALFYPEDPNTLVSMITISHLQNIGSFIMAPVVVEVWGGPDSAHLTLIKRHAPVLPTEYLSNEIKGLDISIPPSRKACYKIVARPVAALPAWHKQTGKKGWFFVDEIYFYANASSALVPQTDG